MSGNFVTIDEAATLLHTTKSYIYQLVHRRKIPYFKPLGGKLLFDATELESFIRKSECKTDKGGIK